MKEILYPQLLLMLAHQVIQVHLAMSHTKSFVIKEIQAATALESIMEFVVMQYATNMPGSFRSYLGLYLSWPKNFAT